MDGQKKIKNWDIKIYIWQYTVCGSFLNGIENDKTSKSKMTLLTFLVHITNLVVNN